MIKQYMTAMTAAQCRNQYACIEKKTATNKPIDKVTQLINIYKSWQSKV